MWIVRLALRRPYTFAVFAILLLIIGAYSIFSMPTDIFPNIDIPVVSVVWQYQGLSAEELANRITSNSERGMTTTVNDIEHIESQTLNGIAVIKVFFQPHANIASAVAQVNSINQVQLRSLPPGTTPPFIIQYNASSVPVLQLGLSGTGLSEQQLNDYGQNIIRTRLATVEGAAIPYPYGGKQRQIQVDLDIHAMQAKGLSPTDVINAVSAQNLIVPSGTMKVGRYEYAIETNSSPSIVNELNNLPVKTINGAVIYVRDVAHVRDGFPPQTNIVRVDGQRSSLMTILKSGNASTLEIIKGIYEKLPPILRTLDPEPKVTPLNDQSIFVRGAINGVVREAIIAACLTGMMILIFLGSWRSTVIIAVSIPLSILSSLIMLSALGETINIMTLGGLALAVGILVDDATVEIENINRNLESGKEIEQAILDGAAQIAIPAFVSTLAICIVFVPMFFLSGVSRYLFVPLAEAVVFAMLASYLLSRTVVPTMAKYLLKEHTDEDVEKRKKSRNPFVAFQRGFEHYFEKLRLGYVRLLTFSVDHAVAFLVIFLLICLASVGGLAPQLGQDFFPSVDAGGFKIHVRAHTGTRIEETAAMCDHIDATIRREIPKAELTSIIDNIGLPYSGYNLSYSTSAPVGTADADISVQLNEKHHPSGQYVNRLREVLSREYPGVTFYVLPTDIVTQILNFGLSSPIDIQIIGPRLQENRVYAEKLLNDVKYVAGTADTRIQQPFDLPKWTVNVDRTRSSEVGLAQKDVATSLLVSLSGSFQTTPSFYLDPKNGVSYNVAVQAPQYNIQSLADLRSLPVTPTSGAASMPLSNTASTGAPGAPQTTQVLGNLASLEPGAELGTVSHYDI
ncbi:MAG TPA: efflux RND transporter permease subunit, partial [Acidobacteriaceae bacterium]